MLRTSAASAIAACALVALGLYGCGERVNTAESPGQGDRLARRGGADFSPRTARKGTQGLDATPSSVASAEAPASGDDGIEGEIKRAQIAGKIKQGLSLDQRLQASNIRVATDRGVVTLRGEAPSPKAAARAVEIARFVEGVEDVKDRLTTRSSAVPAERTSASDSQTLVDAGPQAGAATDVMITTQVTSGLLVDKELSRERIDVTTTDRVVTLQGSAPTQEARRRATRLARHIGNVTDVQNNLKVMRPN